jgi:hypothetical protein
VFWLPGYVWTRVLWPAVNGVARISAALLLGPLIVGVLTLLWVQILQTPCELEVLVGLALAILFVGIVLARRTPWQEPLSCTSKDYVIVIIGLLAFTVFMVQYDRDLFQFNCVNEASRQLLGVNRYGPTSGYPLASNLNVRLGNVALVGPSFIAFSSFGPRFVYAVTGALIALFSGLVGREVFQNPKAAAATSCLATFNPYVLSIPINDENLFAWMLGFAVLWALVRRDVPALWLGLVLGLLLGVRHIALLVVPAVAWGLYCQKRQGVEWVKLIFSAGLVCTIWGIHHAYVFGSPFEFESFREYHQDHLHSFLGLEFGFRGLLNYPFHDTWVRTPYNPYPTALLMPFWWLDRFGVLLSSAALLGLFALRRTPLRPSIIVGYGALLWLQLAVLENWMQPNKMGIQLVGSPGLIIATVAGIRWAVGERRRLWIWLTTTGLVACLAWMTSHVDVAVDTRVYTLESQVRTEHEAYRRHELGSITPYSLLPRFDRVAAYSPFDPVRKLSDVAYDFMHTETLSPTPRPSTVASETLVRLRFDVSEPWIQGDQWVHRIASSSDDTRTESVIIELPRVHWADQSPFAVAYYDEVRGILNIALEFGELAYSGDWFMEVTPVRTQVASAEFDVIVPVGTQIIVTDVVADHFSRYYRWQFATDNGQVTGAFRPRTVFTN